MKLHLSGRYSSKTVLSICDENHKYAINPYGDYYIMRYEGYLYDSPKFIDFI